MVNKETTASDKAGAKEQENSTVRIIKKYPNRRIYDTHTSAYIKLDDIRQMVVQGIDFKVVDSKTKEDITRGVLLQLITEQESESDPLFSADNLKSFIHFYDQNQQQSFSEFINQSLAFFQHQQEQFNNSMKEMMNTNPLQVFSDYSKEYNKKNTEMWQQMQTTFFGTKKEDPEE